MFGLFKKNELPAPGQALPGRSEEIETADRHFVLDRPLKGPYPEGTEHILFGMGCFWGAERMFWKLPDIWLTAVGYSGGATPNPTYGEVCSGQTGHAEVVRVTFDPAKIPVTSLLAKFWEGHDSTQGMRQGNDAGTQYRSAIYTTGPEQFEAAQRSRDVFQKQLTASGYGKVTTEITGAGPFYFAEADHQQYLAKVPNGYCGLGGTGLTCAI